MENCSEISCGEVPTHIVYWPGKNPPPKYCTLHAKIARSILCTMGTNVEIQLREEILKKALEYLNHRDGFVRILAQIALFHYGDK